jgi:hypothetical protein
MNREEECTTVLRHLTKNRYDIKRLSQVETLEGLVEQQEGLRCEKGDRE